jgi:hypothetical protein
MNVNQKRTSKPAPVRQPPMDFPNPNVTKSDFVFIAPLRVTNASQIILQTFLSPNYYE